MFKWLARRFSRREARAANVSPANEALWTDFVTQQTAAGETVTSETALTLAGVYRAIWLVSSSMALVPVRVVRPRQDDTREIVRDHPLASILNVEANSWTTGYDLRRIWMVHLLVHGNAYTFVEWDSRGRVSSLTALPPTRVAPRLTEAGEKVYIYRRPNGEDVLLRDGEILHLVGMSYDGIRGYAPIELAAESLGKAIAVDRYGARFFGNDARPGVALKYPGVLSDQARQNLRASFIAQAAGRNKLAPYILEEGMDIESVSIPPEHAQFIQTARWSLGDVSRWFGVPLTMLSELSDSHYANMEQLSTAWVRDTLAPWARAIEARVELTILEDGLQLRHDLRGLLRGDLEARTAHYAAMRQIGVYSANDIRRAEDMPPIEGGDVYLAPLNMVPIDQLGQATEPRAAAPLERRADENPRAARDAMVPVVEDATRSIVAREKADIMRRAEKLIPNGRLADFAEWFDVWLAGHPDWVRRKLSSPIQALAKVVLAEAGAGASEAAVLAEIGETLDVLVDGWVTRTKTDVVTAAQAEDIMAELRQVMERWTKSRASVEAIHMVTRVAESAIRTAYRTQGVTEIVWHTNAGACPLCRSLAGRIVRITAPFVSPGETIFGADNDTEVTPLAVKNHIYHPPLHQSCRCYIGPR